MGMLIAGQWCEQDNIIIDGAYQRNLSNCRAEIEPNDIIDYPGRFHLIASWSCPWSHRTMLIRQLKGLAAYMPLHVTGGKKVQGYAADHGNKWQVPGSQVNILHLHQLYCLNDSNYTGRSTVPILWDSQQQQIISNESTHIMQIFDQLLTPKNSHLPQLQLVPLHLKGAIEKLNEQIYSQLSNAVYRAGFAQSQNAYDEAVHSVFAMLEKLNTRLATSRYLMGDAVTQADWLLFPNLVRFDIDYYLHSRCTMSKLTDYKHLFKYARELYNMPGIADTVNFSAIHKSNYQDSQVLPVMPDIDWSN